RPHRGTTSAGATRLLRVGHHHDHVGLPPLSRRRSARLEHPSLVVERPGTLVASFNHWQIKSFDSPRGAHDLGENQHVSLEEIVDQLYALPPDEFTGAR